MLEDHPDVEVIGQAESGEEAIALVRQNILKWYY
jgi:DNA-binding NarL/FixJ family response regulator